MAEQAEITRLAALLALHSPFDESQTAKAGHEAWTRYAERLIDLIDAGGSMVTMNAASLAAAMTCVGVRFRPSDNPINPDNESVRRVVRALHPVSDATPERSRLRTKPWLVRLTCCGRADGVYAADSWDEAQAFREAYTSGPGVSGGHVGDTGHDRSAVIEDALAASGDAPREGLDVERLAALPTLQAIVDDSSALESIEEIAVILAREYASESHPTKEPTE